MKRETWNEKEGLRWRWQPNDKDKNLEITFIIKKWRGKPKDEEKMLIRRWKSEMKTEAWDEIEDLRGKWTPRYEIKQQEMKMNTKRQRGTLKN